MNGANNFCVWDNLKKNVNFKFELVYVFFIFSADI